MGNEDLDGQSGAGYDGSTEQGSGGNPAWQPFLDVVPQDLHPQVMPLLQEWDKGVNDRFSKVHQEYAPWEEFKKAGIDPEEVRFGLQLTNAIQADPKSVYETLGEYYKFAQAQEESANQGVAGQGQTEQLNDEESALARQLSEVKAQADLMTKYLLSQQQEQQAQQLTAKEEQALEQEFAKLHKAHGDFNEEPILRLMQSGLSAQDAFNYFKSEVSRYTPTPIFATGGGGLPSQNIPVGKMSESQMNNYVVQRLQQVKQANRE